MIETRLTIADDWRLKILVRELFRRWLMESKKEADAESSQH